MLELSGLTAKKDKNEILDELIQSAANHNVLGLFFDGAEEMITTSVLDITDAGENKVVCFEKTDLHGYPLERNPVMLSEIRSVIHFNTRFQDPVYAAIRQRRSRDSNHLAA
jgi:hypothetical protein